MKRKIINAIIIILLAVAAISGFLFFREFRSAKEETREYAVIQEQFAPEAYTPNTSAADEPTGISDDGTATPPEWAGLPLLEVDFESLLRENPDTVGWIAIPNTPVRHPVVQAADNAKYLSTSFNGNYSKAGTPFADMGNSIENLDANTIIYGHNMGAGRDDMFSSLLLYKNQDYFLENRYIQFDTVYENHGWWEVFAVIEYDARTDGFQYLQLRFNNDDSFTDWVAGIRGRSFHDSGIQIYPHCRILTLSTCDRGRYGRDGRLIVLAANISDIHQSG
jgi:sortase B